jgi:WhiB family redox-sensing transcriptional regulator
MMTAQLYLMRKNLHRLEDYTWKEFALCRDLDPNLFYPFDSDVAEIEAAKKICQSCPVKNACLEAGLLNQEHGIWGGHTERERRSIIRKRNAQKLRTRKNN